MNPRAAAKQTPDELASLEKRARLFWGDQMVDSGDRVFDPVTRRYVLAATYVPKDETKASQPGAEITSKVCSSCGRDLELSRFGRSRGGRGGVKATCKACCAADARAYGRTPQGKVARARALAKYRAHLAGEARQAKKNAAFIEAVGKTPAGQAILDSIGMVMRKEASPGRTNVNNC